MSGQQTIRQALRHAADPAKARILSSFFKTGKGQYAEGDRFLGVTVPVQRAIARRFCTATPACLHSLLLSTIHEERLTALLILVQQFAAAGPADRRTLFDFYVAHRCSVNNWDLVDLTADKIVGPAAEDRGSALLVHMAKSPHLWTRRSAIVATFHFIKQGKPGPTLKIARLLLHDRHDLIQKATGWMLREVGKRCSSHILESFLDAHCRSMPRTMLRYAIERLPERSRCSYLRRK